MAVTAAQVKELRERTGAGMMECKKALTDAQGDIDKAILLLRERGLSRAQKKAGRVATEGIVSVLTSDDGTTGVLLEVNCETDFVAKNDEFQKFVEEATRLALDHKVTSTEELGSIKMSSGQTVAEELTQLIAKIGENMTLRRVGFLSTSNGFVDAYSHMGGKIASLVALEGISRDQGQELSHDIVMHIAASAPRYLSSEDVDAAELEQEKELIRKRLLDEGKPENMLDKIMAGQVQKFFKEVCLLEQPFVKDPKTSIKQLLEKAGATISSFKRFQLGEGLEKKQEDFAAEVEKAKKV